MKRATLVIEFESTPLLNFLRELRQQGVPFLEHYCELPNAPIKFIGSKLAIKEIDDYCAGGPGILETILIIRDRDLPMVRLMAPSEMALDYLIYG
jgi:hypothetical protein